VTGIWTAISSEVIKNKEGSVVKDPPVRELIDSKPFFMEAEYYSDMWKTLRKQ
jgi:hypothetical protein